MYGIMSGTFKFNEIKINVEYSIPSQYRVSTRRRHRDSNALWDGMGGLVAQLWLLLKNKGTF